MSSNYLDERLKRLEVDRPPIHRALVLGGDSPLGLEILSALSARRIAARGLRSWQSVGVSARPSEVHPSTGAAGSAVEAESPLEIEWSVGSLGDLQSLERAAWGCDAMICAQPWWREALPEAIEGLRAALAVAASAEMSRVVFVSSWWTVGEPGEAGRPASEGDRILPGAGVGPEVEAAAFLELEALKAAGCGLPVIVVNPTWCLGPRGVPEGIEGWFRACVEGRGRLAPRGRVNVIDARDAAAGIVEAACSGREGRRYILGGHGVEVEALMGKVASVVGARGPLGRAPDGVVEAIGRWSGRVASVSGGRGFLSAAEARQMVRRAEVSNERAARELGLRPRPLEETLQAAVEATVGGPKGAGGLLGS